ncbi:hypothetical protein MIR68_005672 [Amoeboaphelidium protococcarum]|nr:hypothetical protein MIR68_005672 [Amoeboaphelidium protococcarum]KAI3648584.1 hypothetical protein MP228_006438 [Amoeboaphelidium protococcarum]KAI3649369.1 hypothetical protein MP228_005776 [Amoeboaphelidium protococcarum]KAI3649829.1 hypothetical protein MP228_005461 [Amoeboaphelidium protococcarum]
MGVMIWVISDWGLYNILLVNRTLSPAGLSILDSSYIHHPVSLKLRYLQLLPFPAKKLQMMTFSKSGLDNILQLTQFQKLFNIPTLTSKYNGKLISFCTDVKSLSFGYEVQKNVTSELIYGKCISVVPYPNCSNQNAIGNDQIAAHQDFNSKDEVESYESRR